MGGVGVDGGGVVEEAGEGGVRGGEEEGDVVSLILDFSVVFGVERE